VTRKPGKLLQTGSKKKSLRKQYSILLKAVGWLWKGISDTNEKSLSEFDSSIFLCGLESLGQWKHMPIFASL
jgi:hypothetical protein